MKQFIFLLVLLQLLIGCDKSPVDTDPGNNPTGPNGLPNIPNSDVAKTLLLTSSLRDFTTDNGIGSLTAYNADGSIKWKIDSIANRGLSDPVYGNGILFVRCSSLKTVGGVEIREIYLHAIDANTGLILWKIGPSPYHYYDLIPKDDVLFCSVGTFNIHNIHHIVGYNAKTGVEIFKEKAAGEYGPMKLIFDGSILYYISHSLNTLGSIVAYDIVSKTQKWQTPIGYNVGDEPSDLVISNDMVCLKNGTGRVLALEKKTGVVVWSKQGQYHQPVFGNNLIFSVEDQSGLLGFDALTGVQKWIWKPEMRSFYIHTPYYSADRLFFFAWDSLDFKLHSVIAKTGKLLWKGDAGSDYVDPPIIAGNKVYALHRAIGPSPTASIRVYDANTGSFKEFLKNLDVRPDYGELKIITASGKFLESNFKK